MSEFRNLRTALALAAAFASVAPCGTAYAEDETQPNVRIEIQIQRAAFVDSGTGRTTRQSNQTQFLIVAGGMQGTIFVGKQTPRVIWYYDYLRNNGYLTGELQFTDVGTSLVVRPRVLPNGLIEVELTPEISYETADGSGSIAITRFTTTMTVWNGQSVTVGGQFSRSEFESEFYKTQAGEALEVILTPSIA